MKITLKIADLNFYSDPRRVEAYRRAVEIRDFSRAQNGNSGPDRWEHFTWTTPTRKGVEVEEVIIDKEEGVIIYHLTEDAIIVS